MADYELIGRTLGHSFSKQIHESLGAYAYSLQELPDEVAVQDYFAKRNFAGCNVTIPYKKTVIPLLDALDARAKAIGSVNTVVNRHGHLTGYNTDYDGFCYLLASKGISLAGKKVLVMGTGGTSHTVAAVAQQEGAREILFASQKPAGQAGVVAYDEAARQKDVQILINASPCGMYPANAQPLLLPLEGFPHLEAVVDVVYNPLRTRLLYEAEQRGIAAVGGLGMLVAQAVAAARLFSKLPFGAEDTKRVQAQLLQQLCSIVLVGMPSSGKTQLGQALAQRLGKPFVDLDKQLEQKNARTIPEIFAQDGEEAFRTLESEILAEETALSGKVIATGGGVVTRLQNHFFLKQNAMVVCINRPLQLLHTGGVRPLSHSADALAAMLQKRAPMYAAASDICVDNSGDFAQTLESILEAYNAFISS